MIERKSDSTVQEKVRAAEPCMWANLASTPTPPDDELGDEVEAAERRMARAAPLLRALFPSIKDVVDPLRSPLTPADALARALGESGPEAGRWFVKADHQLPIAGSVKARGGFHEVIALAERLAIEAGLLAPEDDLTRLASPEARELFGRYEVLVGSTGNLGMGIGLIASALGFKAVVHMSSDAKAWKKQRLRDHGVEVIEHVGDYAMAVANGRDAAAANPFAHFVDDEASLDLFVGYAAAARELQAQLLEAGVEVDAEHPLFVYIPCGVGGAPGGVTYGLKRVFGAHVHCVFAEPLQAPCMLVQLLAGVDQPVSVYDLGLTNKTEADGLAVGQASMLVAPLMVSRLAGIYTVPDDQLFTLVRLGVEAQGLEVEPSAAAAFAGPLYLAHTASGQDYLRTRNLSQVMDRATHVLWTTGGSLVPAKERAAFLAHPGAETARFELRTS